MSVIKRGRRRTVLMLFQKRENQFVYVGMFLNPNHVEKYFNGKVDNSQIGRYLKKEIHTILENYALIELRSDLQDVAEIDFNTAMRLITQKKV